MNKPIILVLHQDYNGINIPIDPTSLSFSGHTNGDYYTGTDRVDCFLSFIPVSKLDASQIAEDLKNKLSLTVDKDKYVHLRTTFDSYESDKRPRISVRLPSGYAGLHNPAGFSTRAEFRGLSKY